MTVSAVALVDAADLLDLDFLFEGLVRLWLEIPDPGRFSFRLRLRRAPTIEERTPN